MRVDSGQSAINAIIRIAAVLNVRTVLSLRVPFCSLCTTAASTLKGMIYHSSNPDDLATIRAHCWPKHYHRLNGEFAYSGQTGAQFRPRDFFAIEQDLVFRRQFQYA